MALSIGADIEEISRFNKLDKKILNKIFTEKELEYCFNKKNYSQHLAARFAGKEAVIKALSSFKEKINLNDIEILNNRGKIPTVKLKNAKKYDIKISLSHNKNNAIAFVLISKGKR